jgi:hypothetical protein
MIPRWLRVSTFWLRVYYNLQEIGRPNLDQVLTDFVEKQGLA